MELVNPSECVRACAHHNHRDHKGLLENSFLRNKIMTKTDRIALFHFLDRIVSRMRHACQRPMTNYHSLLCMRLLYDFHLSYLRWMGA